jgi:predicted O-methyltransferase YrrM
LKCNLVGERKAMNRLLQDQWSQAKILEIQAKKRQWDEDDTPIVDGTLPNPGPFDSLTPTVKLSARASETWQALERVYHLVLLCEPVVVLEMGTNVGFSTAYIATALKAVGKGGKIQTLDASPYKLRLAKRMHQELGLDNVDYTCGLFYDVLPTVLEAMGEKIDLAFVDGQHEYKPTFDFFEAISAKAARGSILLFDDIDGYSEEMDQVWMRIKKDDRVYSSTQFGNIGLVVLR